MKNKAKIILAAGGTGGHLFPAKALCAELIRSGYELHIITDKRALKLVKDFDVARVHVVNSATFGRKTPLAIIKTIIKLTLGIYQSYKIIRNVRPQIVGGFGGYPTLPPLLVATSFIGKLYKIKSFIHEQNAVMGRANRFLGKRVDVIAGGFLAKKGEFAEKIIQTGNPVRDEIIRNSIFLYKAASHNEKFNLLVFGGSQGASFFSELLPQAIAQLDLQYRKRLNLVQQMRRTDQRLKAIYRKMGVRAQIELFFDDLPQKMVDAHLIICRSGASTVSEIAVMGRPAILVPYPHALDNDQQRNAEYLAKMGGAIIYQQKELDAAILSSILKDVMDNPAKLLKQAKCAKRAGNPQATSSLVKIVDDLLQ